MTRALDRANIQVGDAPLSNRNHLINGAFAVAQRGTSFTSSDSANNDDTYVLDRWYILSDGNDIIDVSQETTTIPTNGKYAIALDVETANKKFGIAQIIEGKNCVGLIGDTITFSFKAKVSDTSKLDNVKAAIVSWSGTEDSVTSDIISAWGNEGTNPTLIANATYENTPANLSLTTSYATYSVSANVDTSGTKNIIVFIWSDVTDTTAGHFLYVTDCQLERGNTATPFEHRSFGDEEQRCLRYFYKISSSIGYPFAKQYDANYRMNTVKFPVRMRTVPTDTVSTTGGSLTEYQPDRDHWKGYINLTSTNTTAQTLVGATFDAEL
tara:strand:- start:188 stop:1162 length:975 start_codon:yes stop_codon:yes gene_type:complete